MDIEWWNHSRQNIDDRAIMQLSQKAAGHLGAQVIGLKLEYNRVGARGAMCLAQLLRQCRRPRISSSVCVECWGVDRFIAALHLDNNAIGDLGAW